MKHWKPKAPNFTWLMAFIAAFLGVFPFIFGLSILIRDSTHSMSVLTPLLPDLIQVTVYTLTQATYSAIIVGCFAPFFAIGLFYLPKRVRRISSTLRTLSFCIPSIVVATGVILAWGNNGSATRFFEFIGLASPFSKIVYSRYAIVFANAVMNLPFASLMVFRGLCEIPKAQLESAELLGLNTLKKWRYIAWPTIVPTTAYFAGMTFLLSLGSFGALSILGGGPANQTLELAIFQSIYYDANWFGAAVFSLAHTLLAGTASAIFIIPQYRWLKSYLTNDVKSKSNERILIRFIGLPPGGQIIFGLSTLVLDVFIAIPILAILTDALISTLNQSPATMTHYLVLLSSVWRSLTYAVPAAILATISAFLVSRAFCRYKAALSPAKAKIILGISLTSAIIPAMAAAFGILVIRSVHETLPLGTGVIVLLHTAFILPFLISIILPRYGQHLSPFEPLRVMNGVSNLKWAFFIEGRVLSKTLAIALAIGLALSMNETAIVSMLGEPETPALTTAMIQMMGHYRFGDAAIASCVLIIATALPIWLTSREGVHNNDTA